MALQKDIQREVRDSQFGDQTVINQGNVHGDFHIHFPRPPAPAGAVRAIPYTRNGDLVYRQDLINKLDKILSQGSGFHSAALWGLGGSGKTQIALDYAYRRCDDCDCSVFWVHADNEATFISDYRAIGKKLGVDEGLGDLDLLDAVRNKIEAGSPWVIIIDNADDLRLFGVGVRGEEVRESLLGYIPQAPQGNVLWTTRDEHIAGTLVGVRQGIEVRSMKQEEATELLAKARDNDSTASEMGASALLEELQWLPLAIWQAGGFMRRTSTTIQEYLLLLAEGKTRWEVLKESDFDRHRRPGVSNSVLETWKISTQRIREESEMSYRILHVIAYLDSQDIPEELMVLASQRIVGEEDEASLTTKLEVRRAITRLKEFSFLSMRRQDSGNMYEMHKLVQEAVRYSLKLKGEPEMRAVECTGSESRSDDSAGYYSGIALRVVDDAFPGSEQTSWGQCEQYLSHALRVGEWAEVSKTEIRTSALLTRVSNFLHARGRWREEELADERALDLRREILGEKHPDTISNMASLATTYYQQGRYNEAESLYQETLDLRQEILGEKHPDTVLSMASLATTYYEQGRYKKAEMIHQEALDLLKKILGERHPDTIWSMAELGKVYYKQGRYNEDKEISIKVLGLRREILGEKHPDTIWSIASLATTYHTQGEYNKAESLHREALDLRRGVLGERHLDTIGSMAFLATIYLSQGQYNKAEIIHQEAVDLRREILGEKHPDTIWSMAELGKVYYKQGRYDEDKEISVKVLDLRREILGEHHPDTIWSMASLASTYHTQSEYNKAESLHREALDLRREILGERHPDTIESMAFLATTYSAQGRHNEAEVILQEVLDLQQDVLREKHPAAIWSMASLANTYYQQGRYNKAESLHQEALDLRQEILGEKHPDTISSMVSLARIYHKQGQYNKAEGLKKQALAFRREVLGEKHPDTISIMADLGIA